MNQSLLMIEDELTPESWTECLWLSSSIIAAKGFEALDLDQGNPFISAAETMRQGAYQTQQLRVELTEA
ncbi:MAG: hypothetical protein ON057_002069 [Glomeribacter sp. 1016415]|nr:hypothetical protein [Glomeribacter sp. 1016415]